VIGRMPIRNVKLSSSASQPTPNSATDGQILVNRPIPGPMGSCQFGSHLLGAPLQANQIEGLLDNYWCPCLGFVDTLASCISKEASLSGTIPPKSGITRNLKTQRRSMVVKDGRNLDFILSGFHQCCKLITFTLAWVLIGK